MSDFRSKIRSNHENTADDNEVEKIKEEQEIQTQEQKEQDVNPLEEENKKLKETLMRTLAELENTRKREAKEKEDIKKYAISKFAEDLVKVMENFELAFQNIKDDTPDKSFLDGMKLTKKEFEKIFSQNGLIRIYPLNDVFNPELHEAIAHIESDAEEGKVVDVMQAGWTINGRILKSALVTVSKGKNK